MNAPHVNAPNTLPTHISPVNQPYRTQTRCRSSSSILHQRQNMVPPAIALTQNAAICEHKCQHARRQQQSIVPMILAVTPQLAYALSSCDCSGWLSDVLHAWAQNCRDMVLRCGEEGRYVIRNTVWGDGAVTSGA